MENELIESILAWWAENEDDTFPVDAGDGYSEEVKVYNEEPAFVTLAKRLKSERNGIQK